MHRLNIPTICQKRLSLPLLPLLTHSFTPRRTTLKNRSPSPNERGRERERERVAESSRVASEHFVAPPRGLSIHPLSRWEGRRCKCINRLRRHQYMSDAAHLHRRYYPFPRLGILLILRGCSANFPQCDIVWGPTKMNKAVEKNRKQLRYTIPFIFCLLSLPRNRLLPRDGLYVQLQQQLY